MSTILQIIRRTQLSNNDKSKYTFDRLVRNAFDDKNTTQDDADQYILLAHKHHLPCLDSLLNDYDTISTLNF